MRVRVRAITCVTSSRRRTWVRIVEPIAPVAPTMMIFIAGLGVSEVEEVVSCLRLLAVDWFGW
jgi:hypothetical protein